MMTQQEAYALFQLHLDRVEATTPRGRLAAIRAAAKEAGMSASRFGKLLHKKQPKEDKQLTLF